MKWGRNLEHRGNLTTRMQSIDPVFIPDTLIPTDGRNIRYHQLESIWRTLCLAGDVVPRAALRGIVEELVENRNRIAHGSDSAADVRTFDIQTPI